jgi:uncharacterized protein (TIGR02271 family)
MADWNELQKTAIAGDAEAREIVVPLFTEEISVSKRMVEKGRVQVSRTTSRREELVDELLAREQVEVERIPVGRPVDSMPAIREEGETIVVPVVEEILVSSVAWSSRRRYAFAGCVARNGTRSA